MRIKTALSASVWVVMTMLIAATVPASAQDLTGTYRVDGRNPDGSTYTGTATIDGTEGGVCAINWVMSNNQTSQAFCMRQDDVLGAAYIIDQSVGLIIYRLGKQGALEGTWSIAGQEGIGEEVLTPQ